MTIYYFNKDMGESMYCFGTGEEQYYESPEALITAYHDFIGKPNRKEKYKNIIISKEIPDFDFYALQQWVDGFGNDTLTIMICRTKEEAEHYNTTKYNNDCVIVGQWYNQEYRDYWG